MGVISRAGRTCWARLLMAAWVGACVAACRSETPLRSDRFDVALEAQANGDLIVREDIAIAPDGGSMTTFERRISATRADAVQFLSAESSDPTARMTTTESSGGLRVRWDIAPAVDSRAFVLTYRAVRAVEPAGVRGRIAWPAVPSGRDYPIGSSRVTFAAPVGVPTFQGTGIAEAGWQVERTDRGIAGQRRDLPPAEGATLLVELPIDRRALGQPQWQRDADLADQMVPAFASGGLFILIIGAGVLWLMHLQYGRPESRETASDRAAAARALKNAGLVTLAVALFCAVLTELTLTRYGIWRIALPISIAVTGVALIAGQRLPEGRRQGCHDEH